MHGAPGHGSGARPDHGVIPAQAGIHPEMPLLPEMVEDLRMGPGLRRGDPVVGMKTEHAISTAMPVMTGSQ